MSTCKTRADCIIYQSPTAEAGLQELAAFETKWGDKYASIGKSWRAKWEHVATLFDYSPEIRNVIYTTNAIESLNSVIRKAIKNRKIFPNDNSAFKAVYLAMIHAAQKWTMPLRDWKAALNRFVIEFGERVPKLE